MKKRDFLVCIMFCISFFFHLSARGQTKSPKKSQLIAFGETVETTRLISFLKSKDPKVRSAAEKALLKRGAKSTTALLKANRLGNHFVQVHTVKVLGHILAKEMDTLRDLFAATLGEKRELCLMYVTTKGRRYRTIQELEILRKRYKDIQQKTANSTIQFLALHRKVFPVLLQGAKSRSFALKAATLKVFGELHEENILFPMRLKKVAKNKHKKFRALRIESRKLAKVLRHQRKSLLQALFGSLRDKNHRVRIASIKVLEKKEIFTARAVRFLGNALKDKRTSVRKAALTALEELDHKHKGLIPALLKGLRDKKGRLRLIVLEVLHERSPKKNLRFNTLAEALKDKRVKLRLFALKKITEDVYRNTKVHKALAQAYNDKSARVRLQVVKNLGMFIPEKKVALSILLKALHDKDHRVVRTATKYLSDSGPIAVPKLAGLLRHKKWFFRKRAIQILGEMRGSNLRSIPVLIRGLSHPEARTRIQIIHTLKKRYVMRSLIIAAITKCLKDPHPSVRKVAKQALKKMDD